MVDNKRKTTQTEGQIIQWPKEQDKKTYNDLQTEGQTII